MSDNSYKLLIKTLNRRRRNPLPSLEKTIRDLEKLVGFKPVKIDCCVDGCAAFTGTRRHATRCKCGKPRYQVPLETDADTPLESPINPAENDGVPYWEWLLNPKGRGVSSDSI